MVLSQNDKESKVYYSYRKIPCPGIFPNARGIPVKGGVTGVISIQDKAVLLHG